LLDDNPDGSLQTTATNGSDGGNELLGLAGTDEITVLQDAETEIFVSDLVTLDWPGVLSELDEEINFSGFSHADTHLFLINTADDAGLFLYTDNGGDDVIEATDLQLLSIIINQNDSTGIVASDIVII